MEIERIPLGQFYICYGKYLLLSERDRAAVMAVIELYLQTKDV
jgi:hypothetical protein